jgi:hypothetical protein
MFKSSLGRLGLFLVSLLGLMSLFSASAFAEGAPVVTAGAPEKSLNTALLQGTINPNGAETTYKIEYGQSKLYGKSTSTRNVGKGSAPVPGSYLLYGLEPGTTWHYRISATNKFGTIVSEDVQFEMLLEWKVGGKYLWEAPFISEYPEGVSYGNEARYPTTFVAEATLYESPTKIICEEAAPYHGSHLGVNYNFEFKTSSCKTFVEGTEQPSCNPSTNLVIELNAVMVPAANTRINLSSKCPVGTYLPLGGSGFMVGALPEAKGVSVTLTEIAPISVTNTMKVTISHPEWILTGPWGGLKFGIS